MLWPNCLWLGWVELRAGTCKLLFMSWLSSEQFVTCHQLWAGRKNATTQIITSRPLTTRRQRQHFYPFPARWRELYEFCVAGAAGQIKYSPLGDFVRDKGWSQHRERAAIKIRQCEAGAESRGESAYSELSPGNWCNVGGMETAYQARPGPNISEQLRAQHYCWQQGRCSCSLLARPDLKRVTINIKR